MSKKIYPYVIIAGALLLVVNGGLAIRLSKTPSETIRKLSPETDISATPTALPSPRAAATEATHKTFRAVDIPGRASAFTFTATIPTQWQVEAVPAIEALNIYDPSATNATNLEKSRIFIRYFRANTFLTLSTVNILERREHKVNGQPAITYSIEKKPSAPNFPNQPAWRNLKHRVSDIRASDANPSVFYVFAKRPELPDAEFETFLDSLNLNPGSTSFYYPIENFLTGITKKPFGIFITPEDSPAQPERFRGFHTGVDVETPQTDDPIPIFAIADGTVVLSQTASGYGGVLAIRHAVEDKNILGIYGHLNPATMAKVGTVIKGGQQIGTLGKGFTAETDFERKHLHFGIYRGTDINIRGYMSDRSELTGWYDPLKFLNDLDEANPWQVLTP